MPVTPHESMNIGIHASGGYGSRLPRLIAEKRSRAKSGRNRRPRTGKSGSAIRVLILVLAIALLLSALPLLVLRWLDPPTSSFMLQRQWQSESIGDTNFILHYEWVDWQQLSAELKIAVVAAEDQQFPHHFGFDLDSINSALQARKRGRSSRGASTISQQVVKNLFLWPGKSWFRKGIEAWLTILLEALCPKQRILEVYLNIAQWGDNQFGAQAASERYFAKNAGQLNRRESALLAAVLPNPIRFRVDSPSSYTIERRRWILVQIRALGGPAYLSGM